MSLPAVLAVLAGRLTGSMDELAGALGVHAARALAESAQAPYSARIGGCSSTKLLRQGIAAGCMATGCGRRGDGGFVGSEGAVRAPAETWNFCVCVQAWMEGPARLKTQKRQES